MSSLEDKLRRFGVEPASLGARPDQPGDDLKSQAQENTRKLRELIQEGEKIRARIGLNLQGKYGPFNEKLVKFGFQPRREARRGESKAKTKAPQEATSAS